MESRILFSVALDLKEITSNSYDGDGCRIFFSIEIDKLHFTTPSIILME